MFKSLIFVVAIFLFAGCSESRRELVAFKNSTQVDGGFFLGCGQVDSKPVYKFMYKDLDGGIYLDYTSTNRSVIYFIKSGEKPYVIFHHVISDVEKSEFYIPENSINYEYKVDLSE